MSGWDGWDEVSIEVKIDFFVTFVSCKPFFVLKIGSTKEVVMITRHPFNYDILIINMTHTPSIDNNAMHNNSRFCIV